MPLIAHPFVGAIDTDSPDSEIPKGFFRDARNIVLRGYKGNKRIENIPGNTIINNPYLPITGTNYGIGAHYDSVNKRIFCFVYNTLGTHGIYIFNTISQLWNVLIKTGVNTIGDPLGFSLNGRVNSIDILYGDANDGDLLFFIDSQQRPTKININRYLAGTYNSISRSYIDVIKAPPVMPPKCCYENDYNVQNNNLKNSLFQFCESFIYDDNEESVISAASKIPLPLNTFDTLQNIDKSLDSRISIFVQTGDETVKKIRIYGKQINSGTKSDWFIITTIKKSDLNIGNNTVYKFLFYNNGNYVAADPKYTVLLFDNFPQKANCQSLLNGTTISYAGITEGYNYIKSLINATNAPNGSFSSAYKFWDLKGSTFFASYDGTKTLGYNNLRIYLTGAGINNGDGVPTSLTFPPSDYYVNVQNGTTNVSFSFNNNNSYTDIATILLYLQNAAVSAGWVVVTPATIGLNYIQIYYPDNSQVLNSCYANGFYSGALLTNYLPPVFALYPKSSYSFGVVYYDSVGRTNGVINNVNANISTLDYTPQAITIPEIIIDLSQYQPPSWAYYYHIVRTDGLTYSKYLNWVSNYANNAINSATGQKYAYIGISNIDDYNSNINSTQGIVGYEFTNGDRIRFNGVYAVNGSFSSLSFDYAIVGLAVNPLINGTVQIGKFIQISYPTIDISTNFKFDGSSDFQSYNITLYNLKGFNALNQNEYFEIGEQYGILNPGTINASHMGNTAVNTVAFTAGDLFFRTRTVPTAQTYYIPNQNWEQTDPYRTFYTQLSTPITTTNYSIVGGTSHPSGPSPSQYPNNSNNDYIIKNTSFFNLNIRIRGTIQITDKDTANGTWQIFYKIVDSSNNVTFNKITDVIQTPIVGQLYTINLDFSTTLLPTQKIWILAFASQTKEVSGFTMRLDVGNPVTINCFDKSFSDIYNIPANSDGRPNVIDTTSLQTYFGTLFRWSQPYQLGTNINNTNRFYPENFDEWDKSYGPVRRMRIRDRELRIFQDRRCGHTGIYAKYISDNSGTKTLITTDSIITQNNIEYFEGEFGIGNQPDSLISSGYSDYFVDPIKGYVCRLSLDGVKPISLEFMTQTYWGNLLPKYLKNYVDLNGRIAVVLGAFNFVKDKDGEAWFTTQGGIYTYTSGFPPIIQNDTINGDTFAFNERENAWTSHYDFGPDCVVCAENQIYTVQGGQLYIHNNTSNYCNFYGYQYYPSFQQVYNDNVLEKKSWISLTELSNVIWNSPLIKTQSFSYGYTNQQSNLVDSDFVQLEGEYQACYLCDINSYGGILSGDKLKGSYLNQSFTVTNPSNFCYISKISIKYNDSALTTQ
jgi:hypothetical protein